MDQKEFRRCLSRFSTGVTVVSWLDENESPRGITVNSFTSVSLNPPLVLVSIDRNARAHDGLNGKDFVVNILAGDQESLALQFAGKGEPDFDVEWIDTKFGPKIQGALAALSCSPWRAYDGGDHTLYIGQVEDFVYTEGSALMFYQGKFLATSDLLGVGN